MAKVMIGVDYGSYSFNAASSQVTINLPSGSPKLEGVLLITNVTDNIIIYNFSDAALGGVLSGNVLTLDYSTVAMSNSDRLQVWYYAEETPESRLIENLATNQPIPDNAGRMRVILEGTNNINIVSSVSSVSTVATVSTVTGLTNIGGFSGAPVVGALLQTPVEVQMQKIVIT